MCCLTVANVLCECRESVADRRWQASVVDDILLAERE
jgi:hypothetical protein